MGSWRPPAGRVSPCLCVSRCVPHLVKASIAVPCYALLCRGPVATLRTMFCLGCVIRCTHVQSLAHHSAPAVPRCLQLTGTPSADSACAAGSGAAPHRGLPLWARIAIGAGAGAVGLAVLSCLGYWLWVRGKQPAEAPPSLPAYPAPAPAKQEGQRAPQQQQAPLATVMVGEPADVKVTVSSKSAKELKVWRNPVVEEA